jgi:hypothetical protein
MNKASSERDKPPNLVTLEVSSGELAFIEAICINGNKRFKSMRAVSMHLKMTSTRHAVNFINYGNYDKKTGIREKNRLET